jgi:hypothetical protein
MTTLSNTRQTLPPVEHHHPYARLYRAVILRALQDLTQKQYQDEARKWLLSPESDYAFAIARITL